jgi:hypothetical protein
MIFSGEFSDRKAKTNFQDHYGNFFANMQLMFMIMNTMQKSIARQNKNTKKENIGGS